MERGQTNGIVSPVIDVSTSFQVERKPRREKKEGRQIFRKEYLKFAKMKRSGEKRKREEGI